MSATTIAMPKRRVTTIAGKYYVQEQNLDETWKTIGNPYVHSTSAYAALGRIVSKECQGE